MTHVHDPSAAGGRGAGDRGVAGSRLAYERELAYGTGRFFCDRQRDCPWCGSPWLRERLRTTDLIQRKPGRFVLDQCQGCGHIFQNPRLNAEGLEFYYRDFYDGLGKQRLGGVLKAFNTLVRTVTAAGHRRRARSVLPFVAAPQSWLDVGTGSGDFCEAARELLPSTVFDGLDRSEGVEDAERHGRVAHGYRGSFPELAPQLAGRYDVVSMFHYLEHSTDPVRELAAARHVLRPGGLLVIEVPDPSCLYGRLLGRWWMPWLQPQHLHLIPAGNLGRRLGDMGFSVVAEQHREAHFPVDLLAGCWLAINSLAPPSDVPWLEEASPRVRLGLRSAVRLGSVPLLALACLLDQAAAVCAGSTRLSNAYRIVACREKASEEDAAAVPGLLAGICGNPPG
ncbi:class I SAM-dependent methyltransferase [Streptacidiphilus anmyonensis]|uniref:class I SAM-dependent methyltransferase n=1 Tax=Streptacidiphilus anmyonensis TaxID=405782 RepID=UPI0007C7371F|nr:class I SAM-dependent methyltransferase [Streptacidiphilus anmyonensis]